MNIRRISILVVSVLLFIALIYGGLRYYRYHLRQEYDKRRFATALYDPIAIDFQKQIIEVYEKRIEVDFPDSTQVLFANAEKGDLLESTYVAVLKLKIDTKDREVFEKALRQKDKAASISETNYLLNWYYAPGNIWAPKLLKEYQVYSDRSQNHTICIGTDKIGDVIIYLFYGTI